jgi:hypothetical protein
MPTKYIPKIGRTLDARPDRVDLRDREFTPRIQSLPKRFPSNDQIAEQLPAYIASGLVRDQGSDGACTGFGLACVINYLIFRLTTDRAQQRKLRSVSPKMLYHLARFYDEWPGEDYEGSSCRGALKAWHKHGVCEERFWPYRGAKFVKPHPNWDKDALTRTLGVYYRINHNSVVDMQAAIKEIGAIYVSADVHDGWDLPRKAATVVSHDSLPVIRPLRNRKSLGGHAFAMVGYNEQGFIVQNSWGRGWAQGGFAVLPYRDWVNHGSDAWVCAMGVPADPVHVHVSSHVIVNGTPPGQSLLAAGVSIKAQTDAPPSLSASVEPWGEQRAYERTVVFGNDGRAINRLVTQADASAAIEEVACAKAIEFFATGKPPRLAVYAHGGLNSEEESIRRIRHLAPYFEANNIYPVFLTWKTGPLETLRDIIEDELSRVPRPDGGLADRLRKIAADVLDRTIEVVAGPVLKPVWSQMKQNAGASVERNRGGERLVHALKKLNQRVPHLEIHLVGHSAGSIILGHLLDLFPAASLSVASCSLYAPACTAAFAAKHFGGAFDAKTLIDPA